MASPSYRNPKRVNGPGSAGPSTTVATPSNAGTSNTAFAPVKLVGGKQPAPVPMAGGFGAGGGGFQNRTTTQGQNYPLFGSTAASNTYAGQINPPAVVPAHLSPATIAPAPAPPPVGLFSAQPQAAAVPAQQLPPIAPAAAQVAQAAAAPSPAPAPINLRRRQLGGQPDFSPAFELVKEPFSWWRSVGRIFSIGSSLALVSGLVLGTKTIAEYLFPASTVIQVLLRISGSIIGYRLLSWIGNWSSTTNAAVTKIARAANEQAADNRISAQSLKELQELLDIYDVSIVKLQNLWMELPKVNKDDVVITGAQYSQLLSLVTEIEIALNTMDQITGTNHGGDKSAKLRALRDRYKDALLNTLQANPGRREEVDKAFAKLNAIPGAINANIPTPAPNAPIKPFQLPKPNNQQVLPVPAPLPQLPPPQNRVTFLPRQLPPPPADIPKPFLLPPINAQPLSYDRSAPADKVVQPKAPARRKTSTKLKTSPRRAKPRGYTPRARKGVSDGVKRRPYSPSASTKKGASSKKRASPKGAPKKRRAPTGSRAGDSPRSPGGRR